MNVGELIEYLKTCNPAAEIAFAYDSGNYWSEQVAQYVERAETGTLEPDNYSGLWTVIPDEEGNEVILLGTRPGK